MARGDLNRHLGDVDLGGLPTLQRGDVSRLFWTFVRMCMICAALLACVMLSSLWVQP
jgi:hypothetical protein